MKENRVLYIEDDLIDQMAFQRYFEHHEPPFTYEIVNTYADAVRALESKTFDLLIADFYLHDGTAAQVMEHTDAPTIILSGLEIYEIEESLNGKKPFSIIHKDNELNYLSTVLKASFRFFDTHITIQSKYSNENHQLFEDAINFEKLHKTFDGNSKYIADVLLSFLENNPPEIKKLFKLVEAQNWTEAGKVVHKLKSNYNLVGLSQAKECILNIQQLLTIQQPVEEQIMVNCQILSGYTDQACALIEKKLSLMNLRATM